MVKKTLLLLIFFTFLLNFSYAFDEKQVRFLIEDGAYEEAIEILNKERSESFSYFYYYGVVNKELLNFNEAKKYFEKALSINDADINLCVNYGDLLLKMNEIDLLVKKLEEWHKRGIKDNRIELLRAKYYRRMKEYKTALSILNKIADDKTIEEEVLKEKVDVLILSNSNQEAVKTLNRIIIGIYSDNLKNYALQTLKTISIAKQKINFEFSYAYGYDNNVVSKPSDNYYAAFVSGKDDNFHLFSVRFKYFKNFENTIFRLNYDGSYSAYNHLSQYNYFSNDFSINGVYKINQDLNLDITYGIFYSLLDEKSYLLANILTPGISIDTHRLSISIKPFIEKREFMLRPASEHEDRDGYRYGGKVELSKFYRRHFFGLGYEISRDDTEGDNWKTNQHKFHFRAYLKPVNKFITDFYFEYKIDDYLDKHKIFLTERKDKISNVVFTVEYLINKIVSVFGRYVYVNSNSNIMLYDYQRRITTLGLQVRF
jgi:tetratricopeptide (TPR) repeat protein